MAKIIICDICNTDKNVITKHFTVGSEVDAAGSLDDIQWSCDICLNCYIKQLESAIDPYYHRSFEDKAKFNKYLTKRIESKIKGRIVK